MNQKQISHLLIAAGVIAALGILAGAALYAPELAQESLLILSPANADPAQADEIAHRLEWLYWTGLSGVWGAALIFYLALFEYFRVSVRIGQDRSFCPENVKSLRHIAICLAADAALWLIAIFVPGIFGFPVGPAFLVFLLISMANAALSLLAWCLGRLLNRAVTIQQENDLTV